MKPVKHCPNPDCPHRAGCGEAAEYQPQVDLCADCGTTLEWGVAPAAPESSPDTQDARFGEPSGPVVAVAICASPAEAHMKSGILEGAGIPHFLTGGYATGVFGGALSTRIRVPERAADEASRLLADAAADAHPGADFDATAGFDPDDAEADTDYESSELEEHETVEPTSRRFRPVAFFLLVLFLMVLLTVLRRFF